MNRVWPRLNSRPSGAFTSSRFPIWESTPMPRGLLVTSNFAGTIASTHHDAALMILKPY
jgi:hypothetical protein